VSRLLVLLFFALVSTLTACQRDVVPPLIDVTDVSPRELELGDRVELHGAGFPQGRTAHVTFRGVLRRPGERETTGVSIDAEGTVTTTDQIEVPFTEALEDRFCGHGDRAAHTTFAGEVEVAFASSTPGAPPLAGTMRGLVLDVRPSAVRAAVAEQRTSEGGHLLTFLGVVPGAPSARGLPVESVAPGSPAARAGIEAGDVLSAIDGAHVDAVGDLLPASARSIELRVRRADNGAEETRTIGLVGYAGARIPAEYGLALLLVGVALAALLLLVLPSPAALGGLELRLASRLRTVTLTTAARSLFGSGPRVVASILASILVGTFALGPHVIDADLDGAIVLVSAIALVAASRVAASRGLGAALRAAGNVAVMGAILSVAMLGVVALEGAMQLGELVRAQGGLPWELAAARRPAAAVLAFAYLGALFVVLRRKDQAESPSVEILDRLGVFLACALGVAVFFGGWRLPGLAPSGSLGLHLVAALVFVAKTWALVGALRAAVAVAAPCSPTDEHAFVVKRIVPALGVGLALAVVTRRLAPGAAFEGAIGASVAAGAALLAVRSALRVRGALGRPEPHASPFL
jgi:NADH-quinone oxidoreductase subunit H